MKLKCLDGVVRKFYVGKYLHEYDCYTETQCLNCGELFGTSDLKIIKERLKRHNCKIRAASIPQENCAKKDNAETCNTSCKTQRDETPSIFRAVAETRGDIGGHPPFQIHA